MIKDILTATGIKHEQGHFGRMPDETHAVYFDDVEVNGADPVGGPVPRIYEHHTMIELYEPKPDPLAEAKLESELDSRGLPWSKQDRYWLKDVQRYQVVYEFSYTSKT